VARAAHDRRPTETTAKGDLRRDAVLIMAFLGALMWASFHTMAETGEHERTSTR
jgi:hypothetical protein